MTAAFTIEAVQLHCRFEFTLFALTGEVYTCIGTFSGSGSTVLQNMTSDHKPGYTNDDVEYLGVWGEQVGGPNSTFIPQGIENFFRNLKVLRWNTRMTSIVAENLRAFSKVIHLSLDFNSFTSLDSNLFSFTPLLRYIDLDFNRIRHIGENTFTNLTNLEQLYLRDNDCVDAQAHHREAVVSLESWIALNCPPMVTTTGTATAVTSTGTGHKTLTTTQSTMKLN